MVGYIHGYVSLPECTSLHYCMIHDDFTLSPEFPYRYPCFFPLWREYVLSGLVPLVMEYSRIGSSDIEMIHSSLTTTHRSY